MHVKTRCGKQSSAAGRRWSAAWTLAATLAIGCGEAAETERSECERQCGVCVSDAKCAELCGDIVRHLECEDCYTCVNESNGCDRASLQVLGQACWADCLNCPEP